MNSLENFGAAFAALNRKFSALDPQALGAASEMYQQFTRKLVSMDRKNVDVALIEHQVGLLKVYSNLAEVAGQLSDYLTSRAEIEARLIRSVAKFKKKHGSTPNGIGTKGNHDTSRAAVADLAQIKRQQSQVTKLSERIYESVERLESTVMKSMSHLSDLLVLSERLQQKLGDKFPIPTGILPPADHQLEESLRR